VLGPVEPPTCCLEVDRHRSVLLFVLTGLEPSPTLLLLAAVSLNGHVRGVFSAALLQSAQYITTLMHGTPVLIDFAVLEGY
jgi:hypothetical protein